MTDWTKDEIDAFLGDDLQMSLKILGTILGGAAFLGPIAAAVETTPAEVARIAGKLEKCGLLTTVAVDGPRVESCRGRPCRN